MAADRRDNDTRIRRLRFQPPWPDTLPFTLGDGAILLALAALLYLAAHLAFHAPMVVKGPEISLKISALPWYALLSVTRMTVAYALSFVFSLGYGYLAARRGGAEKILMPLLDILQSVPILSFLPVVLLSLSVVLPVQIAAEVACIVLIFTSQVWNMTFSFYQSLVTLPHELSEAAAIFRFAPWLRFRLVELPFAAIGLIWNSMMSWAGGWFFLMAAEMFTVGSRDFRLPGLGSYLHTAADAGDLHAVMLGVLTLVVVIVLLDQLVWRPLLSWSRRFRLETVATAHDSESWLHDLLSRSWLVQQWLERVWEPLVERIDQRMQDPATEIAAPETPLAGSWRQWRSRLWLLLIMLPLLYGAGRAFGMLMTIPAHAWLSIAVGLGATFLRVTIALLLALAWTVPLGVAIGTHPRLAAVLQPVAQVVASIPATALFPVLLLALLNLPGGFEVSAVLLMLLGTQWYLLFNIIAGASAIPQEMRDMTALLRLPLLERWRTLYLPALFPYLVTGAITAGGGAWNASIVAEYVQFGGKTHTTVGIGALIANATAAGNYALLLAATLALIVAVVLINRLFWLRLYRLAERRYSME